MMLCPLLFRLGTYLLVYLYISLWLLCRSRGELDAIVLAADRSIPIVLE